MARILVVQGNTIDLPTIPVSDDDPKEVEKVL